MADRNRKIRFIERALEKVWPELGKTPTQNLKAILPHFDSQTSEANLAACIATLYPDLKPADALNRLTKLRKQVTDAAKEISVDLEFVVDTQKQSPPEERFQWFSGEDPHDTAVEDFAEDASRDRDAPFLERPRGRSDEVQFFISYAHKDETLFNALLDRLPTRLRTLKNPPNIKLWSDHQLVVGEPWNQQIIDQIDRCLVGILLVSENFLDSKTIIDQELRLLREGKKIIIPVALKTIDWEHQELHGLEADQIFHWNFSDGNGARAWNECGTPNQKDEFAHQLAIQIRDRVLGTGKPTFPPSSPSHIPASPREFGAENPECDEEVYNRMADDPDLGDKPFRRPHGKSFDSPEDLKAAFSKPSTADSGPQGQDLLKLLSDWAHDPKSPPYYALLGEMGIGKTTTLKWFARDLLEKRKTDPSLPLPIVIDLRQFAREDGDKYRVPKLDALLDTVLDRAKRRSTGDRADLTHTDILKQVQENRAILIFDGFDEIAVHLMPTQALEFMKELQSALPPEICLPERKRPRSPSSKSDTTEPVTLQQHGKVIISCRSHYFPDIHKQNATFAGKRQDGMRIDDFRAAIVLPFNKEQVRAYLEAFFESKERGDEVFELFSQIHNLRDLSSRPSLLSFLVEHIERLEERWAAGETVTTATIYDEITREWIERDETKHKLDPVYKRLLMEELAAAMWKSGKKQWEWAQLRKWWGEFLLQQPAISNEYKGTAEWHLLEEDLRTATFILRPDDSEKYFRFGHTSIQEYFLAKYFVRALTSGEPENWNLGHMPSLETFDFVGQLLTEEPVSSWQPTFNQILENEAPFGRPQSIERPKGAATEPNVIAFRYFLRAVEQNLPLPTPTRVHLAGADLERWEIRGQSAQQPIQLTNADFTAANLRHTEWEHVNLTGSTFDQADLTTATIQHSNLSHVQFGTTNGCGTNLRNCDLSHADASQANWSQSHWPLSVTHKTQFGSEKNQPSFANQPSQLSKTESEIVSRLGHSDWVNCVAFSSEDRFILTGSHDGSARLWERKTGREIQRYAGHGDWVTSVAFSADDRFILTGSHDGSARLWERETGREIQRYTGHGDSVTSVAFFFRRSLHPHRIF